MEALFAYVTGPAFCLFLLAGLILADIILGIVKAKYNGNFNSSEMRKGGWRKIAEIMSLIVAFGLFNAAPFLPASMAAIGAIGELGYYGLAAFWGLMEIKSLIENVAEITGVDKRKLEGALGVTDEEDQDA